ncbi:MAG: substrate-binding domain-containing protein [Gammaproteobacteria bacterium]
MPKLTIKPAWIFVSETGEQVDPQLFGLLAGIHETEKLTLAAAQIKISYRHAWNLLDKWAQFFGTPLVIRARGKGMRLTPLGAKLLWAEQRSEARFTPQLESLASELNLEISKALRQARPLLRIHASHGYAVAKLPELMDQHGNAQLDLQYMGSVEAIASLVRGGCDLAGFHVPQGEIGLTVSKLYKAHLKQRTYRIIRLVTRTQGFMVARGNPNGIQTLPDLAQAGIRFINRQPGSGTRVLFDEMLRVQGLDAVQIGGYDNIEFTHAAVAAYVASDMADVGFGVEAAARQFRLDFIPIVSEHYMLASRNETLQHAAVQELIGLLKGQAFRAMVGQLPGYHLDEPGQIVTFDELLQRL